MDRFHYTQIIAAVFLLQLVVTSIQPKKYTRTQNWTPKKDKKEKCDGCDSGINTRLASNQLKMNSKYCVHVINKYIETILHYYHLTTATLHCMQTVIFIMIVNCVKSKTIHCVKYHIIMKCIFPFPIESIELIDCLWLYYPS